MTNAGRRRSGLLLPLFSCPSTASWGIGEIADLAPLTAWLARAGQGALQLLPLNEMADGQQSPYSAVSALAIDPLYIRMADVPEFAAAGGESGLSAADRRLLADVRGAPRIDYEGVRQLKRTALAAAFGRFYDDEWIRDGERAREFRDFLLDQAHWVDDYALFRALQDAAPGVPWTGWAQPLRDREQAALAEARRRFAKRILYYAYVQWLADSQWRAAHERARANDVALFGDLPFMVAGDSADVWVHQAIFRLDVSVGAPPDAFSATGQDWGLPLYRWDEIVKVGFPWLRLRARRAAALYDGFRIDHVVGFYRTFGKPRDGGPAFFTPSGEAEQLALGERVLAVLSESGAELVAEDLGTVPAFVRESLARLGIPGFRVFRWERRWDEPGQPFRDPADYPTVSLATSGTHDTEPLAIWWASVSAEDKRQIDRLPTIARVMNGDSVDDRPFNPSVRDALLEALFAAGSNLLILPVQDVFGWDDRINEPATVTEKNWTFRLPWPCDRLDEAPEAYERRERLREWSTTYGRASDSERQESRPSRT